MSLSFSARCVCSDTPCALPKERASSAASRISSRLTEKGLQGATTMRCIAWRFGSCQRSMRRCVSARIAASSSTTLSGGSPPLDSPTLIAPRAAWKRMPICAAASSVSSRRVPLGNR